MILSDWDIVKLRLKKEYYGESVSKMYVQLEVLIHV